MNQINGTVFSVDSDAGVIRLSVDGGYSVEFAFNTQTTVRDGPNSLSPDDLQYGDRVAVRYVGRELVAKQIERLAKAPGAPAAAPAPPPAPEPVPSVETSSGPAAAPSVAPSTGPAASVKPAS